MKLIFRDMYLKYFSRASLFLFLLIVCVNFASGSESIEISESAGIDNADPGPDPQELFLKARQYEYAEGVPRDRQTAIQLYCQAAKLGNSDAQYALGWIYANGRGVVRDDRVALQLFKMAAEQGHEYAGRMEKYVNVSSKLKLPTCLRPDPVDTGIDYSKYPVFKLVEKLAPEYGLDPALVMTVISIESGFNEKAISNKNAQGLMQLIPATAERFQVRDTFDAEENIKGGMAYLRWLLAFFKGDVSLAVAAYNAGEGAVERHGGIPPYQETQKYVKKIQSKYKKMFHPYQSDVVHRYSFLTLSSNINN